MNYRVAMPGRFYDCGESSVVYFDLQTGDTHLVSDFAAHVIETLAIKPMDANTLIDAVAMDIATEDRPDLATVIPDILGELISLDIIEQT